MKLAIATSILAAKTLPQTTGSRMDFVGSLSARKKNEQLATTKKNGRGQNPGTKALTGAVSGLGRHDRSGNELLANRTPQQSGKTFCDPSSQDADIGMLSCNLGYECMVDEFSALGGVCMPSTSRELVEFPSTCYLCGIGLVLGLAYYGNIIDSEDTESGYGGKTCEDTIDAAYFSKSFNTSTCYAVASAVKAAGCCVPVCKLCDRGSRIWSVGANTYTVVDGISLPGYDGNVTCDNLRMASYAKGIIDLGESCTASRQAALAAGCCEKYHCKTCEVGSYIDTPNATLTCYELIGLTYSYFGSTPSEDNCSTATQLAADEGCCTPSPIYNECNFCGDATFYPNNYVYERGTCEIAQSLVPADLCDTYSALFVASCCGVALPAEDTDDKPTGAPVTTVSESWPTSPPSNSSAMRSTGPFSVSMIFLTTSTLLVGAAWLLDLN